MGGRLKGVSPIIATVLLIAVAISVGIMVTTWITQWVVHQTGSESMTCAINTNYIIDTAEFNKSTTLNSTLLLKVTNHGTEKIYGFGVQLDNGTTIMVFNSSSSLIDQGGISSSSKLAQERSAYVKVNLTNTTAGYTTMGTTLTKVTVTNDGCPSVSASTAVITKYP
jgi:flagellin-like protein